MKGINTNNNFQLTIIKFSVVSASENACDLFMAPMRKSFNGSWINQNNDRIVDMKYLWDHREPNGRDLEECTGFIENTCKYYDATCTGKTCFICSWKDAPLFNLRGLCTNTQVDTQFVLLPEKTFGGNIFFFGMEKSNIIFNQESSSWQIVKNKAKEILKPGGIPTDSLDVIGTFEPDQDGDHYLPVGTHFWNLTDCNKGLQLKLTKVRKDITL